MYNWWALVNYAEFVQGCKKSPSGLDGPDTLWQVVV